MPVWLLGLELKYKIIAAVAIMSLLVYSGWYAHKKIIQAEYALQLENMISAHEKELKKSNEKAAEFEKLAAEEREKNLQLNGELKDEIKKPAYNCVLPSDGVRIYRKALGFASTR